MGKPKSESVSSIIEMGRKFEELKPTLSHYDLGKKVFADFGINASSIEKIIKISHHPILSNPEYADKLPPSWALLYELRFLPDEMLLEKLANGGLVGVSKYQVWEWRGVKTKSKNAGNKIRVPDNVSLVAYVNLGMNKEKEFDGDVVATAECLGIGAQTYRMIKQVIILSQYPDLAKADQVLVQSLIDKINKTRNVREYYLKAKPLIEKIWGATQGQRFNEKLSSKRVESYLNSVFLIGMNAQRLIDQEIPYMSTEDVDRAIGELSEAGKLIRKTTENLRRTKHG